MIYGNWSRNAVGYITRFDADGMQWTTPENCLNTTKTGLYASYSRSLFDFWSMTVGGEAFYSHTRSKSLYYRQPSAHSWSGKAELNTSWMLTRKKNLVMTLRCTQYFPYQERMVSYGAHTFLSAEIRYMLLDNRLTLSASVTDPFGWSITRSTTVFDEYTLKTRVNVHQHSTALHIAYSFGGRKVNNVYRDSKERESQRTY
ncbi:MAG: outer membrane beta-barrel protein [Bacteroides sp.]|nr:outer membrane beta-barrel protein [Bacteroides sp.]